MRSTTHKGVKVCDVRIQQMILVTTDKNLTQNIKRTWLYSKTHFWLIQMMHNCYLTVLVFMICGCKLQFQAGYLRQQLQFLGL